MPPIHGFDCLDQEHRQIVHWAWTNAGVQGRAVLTDLTVIVQQIGYDRFAVNFVNPVDQVAKV
jgi:hypothetical protein